MATLSSTNRIRLRYMKEASFGKTPDAGILRDLRLTGETFNFEYTKESSNELNPSRGVSSVIPVDAEASGSLNGEMQYAEYDQLLAGLLQDDWQTYGTNGVSAAMALTLSTTGNTITADAPPSNDDKFSVMQPGQWFTVELANGDSQLYRVASVTDDTITVDSNIVVPNDTLSGAKIRTSRLVNGVDQPSFSIEREVEDVGEFFMYRGMTPSVFNMNIESGSLTTLSFDFLGKSADADSATMFIPANPNDISNEESFRYDSMSSVSGTSCEVWVGGKPLSGTYVQSIALTYDNSLRAQNAICTLGAIGIGAGTIECTIDMEIYFASGRTFYDELLDNGDIEVVFTTFDPQGNGYVWTLPRGNVSSYSLNGDSADQDLMASITVTGLLNNSGNSALNNKVLIVDRVGKAVDFS